MDFLLFFISLAGAVWLMYQVHQKTIERERCGKGRGSPAPSPSDKVLSLCEQKFENCSTASKISPKK